MAFISRDQSGNITGVFHVLQPGFAEEFLADADPAAGTLSISVRTDANADNDVEFVSVAMFGDQA